MEMIPILGQRYISEMEPELGLGEVTAVSGKRLHIYFSSSDIKRIYSLDEPPVKRVHFKNGDTIKNNDGVELTIENSYEKDGIIFYTCGDKVFSETKLAGNLSFTSPMDKLSRHIFDDSSQFDFRYETNKFKKTMLESPVRGFIGGKVELIPHQLYIADYVVSSLKNRFFLADEVGLGKTIEACLIVHRLMITGKINRVLIVVPGSLIHQWFVELFRRFNILSCIVNDEFKNALEISNENLFTYENIVVVSIEDLSQNKKLFTQINETDWDLLIVDEAHHLSDDSDEYEVIVETSQKIAGLLLLTASPEVLDDESFFSLLRLLDPVKYSTFGRFKHEKENYEKTASLVDKILSGKTISIDEIENLDSQVASIIIEQNTNTIVSEEKRIDSVKKLVDICGIGRSMFRNTRTVIKGFPTRKSKIIRITPDINNKSDTQKTSLIHESLVVWIIDYLIKNKNKKILIICHLKEDVFHLDRRLQKWKSIKVALFHEEMSIIKMDRNAAWFAEKDGASVLISSEIGSEGRNFQFADYILFPDLPNDPEKLEQRIGRLDRIGRKMSVQIIVPVIKNSYMDALASWYEEGLNAFDHNVPGAHIIGLKFREDLNSLKCAGSVLSSESINKLASIISHTKDSAKIISERIEKGRNRLLEIFSYNSKEATRLVSQIKAEEKSEVIEEFMDQIFDYFGIEMEEFADHIYHISFDLLSDHNFPIPVMRQKGMLITFNRKKALLREDTEYLTTDHPMVTSAIDLVVNSEKGNCVFTRLENSGEKGFVLETIFIIECNSATKFNPEKYLPPTPIRIAVDDAMDDVSEIFGYNLLSEKVKNISSEVLENFPDIMTSLIKPMQNNSKTIANIEKKRLVQIAIEKIKIDYKKEILRVNELITLSLDAKKELDIIKDEYECLTRCVNSVIIRLDSVRLIQLSE